MRQTVYTPTYNRAKLLPRLYESLKNQSFKDFEWLIIDDGSTDNTEDVVKSFAAEDAIRIRYVKKENGGKYTAQWKAYQIAETPYITEIDSDDTLMPDAVENFENAWIDIELHKEDDIAKVSMFAVGGDGKTIGVGNFSLPAETYHYDASWHRMVLKDRCNKELVSSVKRSDFMDAYNPQNYQWGIGRFLDESVIWSALGRKYSTRLLNKIGRKVYYDADNSILRQGASIEMGGGKCLNNSANSLYFIDENIDYFHWNPRYFSDITVGW